MTTRRQSSPEVRRRIADKIRATNERKRGPRCARDENDCWIWQWALRQGGYPSEGQREGLYMRTHGPYPRAFDLHHSCGQRACVNPWHQLPLTRKQHMLLHVKLRQEGWDALPVEERIALSRALVNEVADEMAAVTVP